MGCLFALFAGIFPRLAPAHRLDRPPGPDGRPAFDSWIWPLLGLIFLPFATLIYVILWTAGGLSGWDWFWVGAGRRCSTSVTGARARPSAARRAATA